MSMSENLDVDSAGTDGIYHSSKDGDLERGASAEPGTQPPSLSADAQSVGLVATVLERTGVTGALDAVGNAAGKAVGDGKAAFQAKWEADKNFRSGCMGVAAVCFVLVFIFHLLANLRRLVALVGMAAIIGGCYAASVERDAVSWPRAMCSLLLQLIVGVLIAYTSVFYLFLWLGDQVKTALSYAHEGGDFVFASYDQYGKQTALAGLDLTYANITATEGIGRDKVSSMVAVVAEVGSRPMGGNFAIAVLPSIIFFSAFVEVANHVGVLPWLMRAFAALFCFFTSCTIPEGVAAAANVFVGMTNAPLLIKPFMQVATPSHLVAIMGAGFGTAGAAMLPVYISMGAPPVHLLAAAWMGAPASLTCAKLLQPDSKLPGTSRVGSEFTIESVRPEKCQNMVEAISRGVNDGTAIAIGVAANLIAIIGLVAFLNGVVGWTADGLGFGVVTLDRIFGYVFTPLAILMGVDSNDYVTVGCLLGQKTLLNEFVAFQSVNTIQNGFSAEFEPMTERSLNIVTYALCGFSNIGSVGMTMSAMTAIAPGQTRVVNEVVMRALVAGCCANFLNACLVGALL